MSESIAVGPSVLSTAALPVLLSWMNGRWVGGRCVRDGDRGVARLLTRTFAIALVAARAACVAEWFDAYLARPLHIPDLRDGGWNLPVGLLLAWLNSMATWSRGVTLESSPASL